MPLASHLHRLRAVRLIASASVAWLAACSSDVSTAPTGEKVSICHLSGSVGTALNVSAPALAAHLAHGDYVTTLVVSQTGTTSHDSVHFRRISDALASATAGRLARGEVHSAACRVTIAVGPGVFRGTLAQPADSTIERLPYVIDVPDLTLQGSFAMQLDANGRATGTSKGGVTTTLAPLEPLPFKNLIATPMFIVNAHPGGSEGNGAVIEGFVVQSGHVGVDTLPGGQALLSMRVRDLVIRGNRFEAGFHETLDLRGGSARIERNHLGGTAGTCDICLAGPGDFQATSNFLLAGGIPGILIVASTLLPVPTQVEQFTYGSTSLVTATVTNNEVHDHLRAPVGVGIRVAAYGPGAPNVAGTAQVVATNNTLINNNFGMIVEAGFPVANTTLRGDLNLTLGGNKISRSCQHDFLVSFSRHTTGLGLTNGATLKSSTYTLALGGDLRWADAWYSHPANLGNTLVVDGQTIPNDSHTAYDATRVCVADPPPGHSTQ